MTSLSPVDGKKYFTLAEANKMLPLVKAIVSDISSLAHSLKEKYEQKVDLEGYVREDLEAAIEKDQDRLQDLVDELSQLGVELKDFFTGLVDFPSWSNGREVYLCWKMDEAAVGHWHEVWAGFAGRVKL